MIIQVSDSIEKPLIIEREDGKYLYQYSLAATSDIPVLPNYFVVGNDKTGKLDFYRKIVTKAKDIPCPSPMK